MALTPQDVSRIAHLARLELSPAEGPVMLAQLNGFFSIVDQMSAVDTSGVEPLYTPLSALQQVSLRLRDNDLRLLRDLQQAIAAEDAGRLHLAAHTIKSSARDFGAGRLAAICQELENCGRAGRLEGATERLWRLEAEYGPVCAALEHEAATCLAEAHAMGAA